MVEHHITRELDGLALRDRQRLMDRALIADGAEIAEHAQLDIRRRQLPAIILIEVAAAAGYARDVEMRVEPSKERPHIRDRLLREIFIRIGKKDPAPMRLFDGKIFRRREIIAPRERK